MTGARPLPFHLRELGRGRPADNSALKGPGPQGPKKGPQDGGREGGRKEHGGTGAAQAPRQGSAQAARQGSAQPQGGKRARLPPLPSLPSLRGGPARPASSSPDGPGASLT